MNVDIFTVCGNVICYANIYYIYSVHGSHVLNEH